MVGLWVRAKVFLLQPARVEEEMAARLIGYSSTLATRLAKVALVMVLVTFFFSATFLLGVVASALRGHRQPQIRAGVHSPAVVQER